MSETNTPETLSPETCGPETPKEFCLWETYLWEELEEELSEMAGTYRGRHEALTQLAPVLPQGPTSELPEPQNNVLQPVEWERLYQLQMLPGSLFHQYSSEWEHVYQEQGILEASHGQCMPDVYFQYGNQSPLAPPLEYQISSTPNSSCFFTCYFWLGGPIDLYNIPGCSEYLPIAISGEMKLVEIFDAYFSKVDANSLSLQPRNMEIYSFMQMMLRDGRPQHGTQNYYQGAKWTGITVRETQWHAWQKFWLVGSDREQAFLKSCEHAKTQRLFQS